MPNVPPPILSQVRTKMELDDLIDLLPGAPVQRLMAEVTPRSQLLIKAGFCLSLSPFSEGFVCLAKQP